MITKTKNENKLRNEEMCEHGKFLQNERGFERKVEDEGKKKKNQKKCNIFFSGYGIRRQIKKYFIWLFILITPMNAQSEFLFLERKMRIMRVRALSRAKITFDFVERKIFRSEKFSFSRLWSKYDTYLVILIKISNPCNKLVFSRIFHWFKHVLTQ
jgi:hypothetical protein